MPGTVLTITIADEDGAPLRTLTEAELIIGRGIAGDRYAGKPDLDPGRAVTLVEAEQIGRFNAETGLGIDPTDTRRNIVTRGLPLNDLVGVAFTVGAVRLRGTGLCEPCGYIAGRLVEATGTTLTAAQVVAALRGRAGLCAEVVAAGTVRVGDAITAPVTA